MLKLPQFDPIALQIGPLAIRWYGLMYLVGFALAWWLGRRRTRNPGWGWSAEQLDDAVFYGALGVILGGRLGYVFFYAFDRFLADPMYLLRITEGGMSFHGGLIGVLVAMWLHGRKTGKSFFEVTDFIAPMIPPGLFFGRIGNFINGELWGRTTDVPWAVIFPDPAAGGLARHPSQLYEAALEGLVLFAVLWWFSSKPRPRMAVSGAFLIGYGVFRSLAEFFREPDAHLQFIAFDWLTMGQLLSFPMIAFGILLMTLAYRRSDAWTNT